jgi:hypothetical protein
VPPSAGRHSSAGSKYPIHRARHRADQTEPLVVRRVCVRLVPRDHRKHLVAAGKRPRERPATGTPRSSRTRHGKHQLQWFRKLVSARIGGVQLCRTQPAHTNLTQAGRHELHPLRRGLGVRVRCDVEITFFIAGSPRDAASASTSMASSVPGSSVGPEPPMWAIWIEFARDQLAPHVPARECPLNCVNGRISHSGTLPGSRQRRSVLGDGGEARQPRWWRD